MPLLLAAAEHAELRARAAAHFVVADADGDGRLTVAVDEFFSQARAYYFLPFGWQGRERLKHCGALAAAAPGGARIGAAAIACCRGGGSHGASRL